jgi:murein DD-endopeptidase MepM/ murein hydrolase activator NlpD
MSDAVKQGDVVALSGASGVNGNTGKPNPAHLHYEIRLCNEKGVYVMTLGMNRGQVDPLGFEPGIERGAALPVATRVMLPFVATGTAT